MRVVWTIGLLVALAACTTQAPGSVPCDQAADCRSDKPICDADVRVCRACVSNNDCAALGGDAPACDAPTGQCVECVVDGDCGSGACVEKSCVECRESSDCEAGVCSDGACVECTTDDDCSSSNAPVCDRGAARCVQCVTSDDCTGGDTGACNPDTNSCVQCVDSDDCLDAALPVCDPVRLACTECLESSDCSDDGRPFCNDETTTCIECRDADDCPSGAPICRDGSCGTCATNEDCAGSGFPVCSPGGECVECTGDSDCASGVCNESQQACLDASAIVYMAPSGNQASCSGTMADPCSRIEQAKELAASGRRTLLFAPGLYPDEGLVGVGIASDDAKALAFVGPGAVIPSNLSILASGELELEGVRVADLDCQGVLEAVGIEAENVTASACDLDIRQSRFGQLRSLASSVVLDANVISFVRLEPSLENQLEGGLWLTDTTFEITNNFIFDNGRTLGEFGTGTQVGGVRIDGTIPTGPTRFAFNTVAYNSADGGTPGPAPGIECAANRAILVSSSIIWENSIGTLGRQIQGCDVAFSIVFGGFPGQSNQQANPRFIDEAARDLHVTPDSPAIDAADPANAPATDVDLDPRPEGAGFDIGADEAS